MATANEYSLWGANLLKQGQVTDATLAFQQALRLDPQSAETHNALSVALRLQRRLDEAIAHCREAVRLAPNMAEAHNNLGSMLDEQGHTEEAIRSFGEAMRLQPDLADAWSNLGVALYRAHRYEAAAAHYRRAIALRPDFAEAHNNLAGAMFELGQSAAALACFTEAIRLNPAYREAHYGRALIWLSRGEFERGWPEFEWRFPGGAAQRYGRPRWDGTDLAGRTILLEAEQGLGDTLQFVRYGSLLQRQGGKVVLVCQPRLVRLLARGCTALDQVMPQGERLPPFDVHLPLLSLPGLLGTTLGSVPADVPYLHPDRDLIKRWRAELSPLPGFKIGVAWQGSRHHRGDRERSIPLSEFEPLARVPGVQLISLQRDSGEDQLEQVRSRFRIIDYADCLDRAAGPFMDTAALMHSLDLVISCDSAVGHLAGAMGIPAWVALSASPDWRWLRNRDDSPWYPTLRLFRQTSHGQWSDVFERMSDSVARIIASTQAGTKGRWLWQLV